MNHQDVIRAAQQAGVNNGETITLQFASEINHPHLHAGQTSGQPHVDGYAVTNNNGNYHVQKFHG